MRENLYLCCAGNNWGCKNEKFLQLELVVIGDVVVVLVAVLKHPLVPSRYGALSRTAQW